MSEPFLNWPDAPGLEAQRQAGLAALRQGDAIRALAQLGPVIAARPADAVALFHAALALQARGDAHSALAFLKRAALAEPAYTLARGVGLYLSRRQLVREGGRFEDGWISLLDIVLRAGPLTTTTLAALAERHAAAPDAPSPIPCRIVQFWDGEQVPDDVAEAVDSCRTQNPGHTHTLFCDAAARDYLLRHDEPAVAAYDACFHPAGKSDVFRACYLDREGGIYIDADERCLAPLAPYVHLPDLDTVLCYADGVPSCVNNGFIATAPGTALTRRLRAICLANMEAVRRHGRTNNVWMLTGPGPMTFALLDEICDPVAWHGGKGADTLTGLALLTHADYATLLEDRPMAYKQEATRNWRMA